MRLRKPFSSVVLILIFCISEFGETDPQSRTDTGIRHTGIAEHTFSNGGVIKNWLAFGPFPIPVLPADSGSENSVKIGFKKDYLGSIGGESQAKIGTSTKVYYTNEKGTRCPVTPQEILERDDGSTVFLGSFLGSDMSIAYAYCNVKSERPFQARCFFGSDGPAKIWIHHKKVYQNWHMEQEYHVLDQWFDVDLDQGDNPVLVKVANISGECRFNFEIYDRGDSLLPFLNRIETLDLDIGQTEIPSGSEYFLATAMFNIRVPQGLFTGRVSLHDLNGDTLSSQDFIVGKFFSVPVSDSIHGTVIVSARVILDGDRELSAERYLFFGDFETEIVEIKRRYDDIKREKTDIITSNKKRDIFIKTLYGQAMERVDSWFIAAGSMPDNARIGQVGDICKILDLMEYINNNDIEKLGGNQFSLLFKNSKQVMDENPSADYDPSVWFDYKYPGDFPNRGKSISMDGIGYWLYLPDDFSRKVKKLPLMVVLHDIGQRGSDLNSIKCFGPSFFADKIDNFPFVVITPQCGNETWWNSRDIKMLIDSILLTGIIDRKRIYITGSGMGAFAVWNMMQEYPDLFAAAVPISGGGNPETACQIRDNAVWIFHGTEDKVVPIEKSYEMIKSLKRCGARRTIFSPYAGVGHNIFNTVYGKAGLYTWMLKQRR